MNPDFELDRIDVGIRREVELLRQHEVETYESCQGGEGHAYPEPTIRFHGERYEGFRALSIAMMYGLKVTSLRRIWQIIDGEPIGADWEIVFSKSAT